MSSPTPPRDGGSILIVGASRGLGQAMAAEFAGRGWTVVGTARSGGTALDALAADHPDRVAAERLDITRPDQVAGLRGRLAGRRFDIVFVNAGTADQAPAATLADVPAEEFARVMLTNVLGVMRAVEALGDLATPDGVIGAMSSGQGSLANNLGGGRDAYRASKAALNQAMRSHAARHKDDGRARLLLAPGWIRTDMGGPDAPFSLEETVPRIVDVVIAQRGVPGLRYLDRFGQTVPW